MLLRLCGNLRGKTERVASRVEEDSPSVRRWLDWRAASSQLLSLLNRGLQICHREIEVDLLGDIARRPCRRLVVRDLHRAQPHPVRADVNGRGGREHDLAAQHRGPELSELDWVGTVQRDETASSDGHGLNLDREQRERTRPVEPARCGDRS